MSDGDEPMTELSVVGVRVELPSQQPIVLLKTLDATAPTPERIELSTIKKQEDGTISHVTLSDAEV